MTQVYVYLRYSGDGQRDGDSITRQRELCAAMIARNGWSKPIELSDEAVSAWTGDNIETGELSKFAARVRSGEVPPGTILVAEKIDRLSRIDPMDAFQWTIDMTNHGLRIATAMDGAIYDREGFRSPMMFAHVVQLLSQHQQANDYSKTISMRLKGSWVRRRQEASEKVVISAHVPGWLEVVGNRGDPNRHFKPIPRRVETVQEIYRLAAEGMGTRTIARTLNQQGHRPFGRGHHHANSTVPGWEHTYVGDILHSAAVEGDYEPGTGRRSHKNKTGERIIGYFGPPIVDAGLVARARFAMTQRRGTGGRGKGSIKLANLFAGLIICGECRGRMRLIGNSAKPNRYLVCQNASSGRGCSQRMTFNYGPFENSMLDTMLHLALDESYFQTPDHTQRLTTELADIEKLIADKKGEAEFAADSFFRTKSTTMEARMLAAEADCSELEIKREEAIGALVAARGSVRG